MNQGSGTPLHVGAYHDLLTGEIAAASQAMLEDQLRRRGLFFGERPLCTVLRPRLFRAADYAALQETVSGLMAAFATAYGAAMAQPPIRRDLRLADWEEDLIQADPGFPDPSPHSRLDLFLADGGASLTEYNAETPAGAGYADALSDAFLDLPVMRAYARQYAVRPLPARHGVAHAVLEAWRQFAGTWRLPSIAIVDWADVPTRSEFVLFERYFHDLGLAAQIVEPAACEFRNGRLYANGTAVDVIYKRVLLHELIADGGVDQPIVRAVRERAVCLVNGFRCKLMHKKASLALLSDERHASLFGGAAARAIRAHVPWTRVVEERRTEFEGSPVDLVPFVAAHRERFVLKPNDDYGGAGIVLGWTVGESAWNDALRTALASPYIVQARVAIAEEPYPSVVDGRLVVIDRMLDTAPFVIDGRYESGCLTRLSTSPLLNVTAGGGSTVPVFVVEPRA
ncbi:MAG TPA: hypothetical protein VL309_10535 [Vicinamibacterales bacterium]|jgi:uncharacterized circularly permuted ATP-grasp superfamily protein|nr:hypothetical protein [Vicinamibacterales bacterium]